MTNDETYDVVIAGCGAGGLYTALNLPSDLSILMIAKTEVDECDSMLAQGGICVLHDETTTKPSSTIRCALAMGRTGTRAWTS